MNVANSADRCAGQIEPVVAVGVHEHAARASAQRWVSRRRWCEPTRGAGRHAFVRRVNCVVRWNSALHARRCDDAGRRRVVACSRRRPRRFNEARRRPRSTPAEHVWLLRSNICRHMTNNYPCAKIRPAFGSPTATASAARSDRKKLLVSVPNANVCCETGCATRPIPSVPPKHMQPDEGTATMSIPMLRARRNAHKHAHALPQLAHPRAPIVAVMRSRPRMQRRAAARCVCGGRVDRPRAPVRASNPRSDVSP